MSREIKFRAWKKENSPEMIHIVSSIDWANKDISFRYRLNSWTFRDDKESLDNIILMQYTGLKDKNGVEIYEGDIIVWEYSEKPQEVFWDNSICGFSTKHYHLWRTVKKVKVIGNIYENPELLEASK